MSQAQIPTPYGILSLPSTPSSTPPTASTAAHEAAWDFLSSFLPTPSSGIHNLVSTETDMDMVRVRLVELKRHMERDEHDGRGDDKQLGNQPQQDDDGGEKRSTGVEKGETRTTKGTTLAQGAFEGTGGAPVTTFASTGIPKMGPPSADPATPPSSPSTHPIRVRPIGYRGHSPHITPLFPSILHPAATSTSSGYHLRLPSLSFLSLSPSPSVYPPSLALASPLRPAHHSATSCPTGSKSPVKDFGSGMESIDEEDELQLDKDSRESMEAEQGPRERSPDTGLSDVKKGPKPAAAEVPPDSSVASRTSPTTSRKEAPRTVEPQQAAEGQIHRWLRTNALSPGVWYSDFSNATSANMFPILSLSVLVAAGYVASNRGFSLLHPFSSNSTSSSPTPRGGADHSAGDARRSGRRSKSTANRERRTRRPRSKVTDGARKSVGAGGSVSPEEGVVGLAAPG